MEVEVGRLCLFRGPLGVGVPGVRAGLEGGYLPRRLFSLSVQVVTEEGGFDILPELEGGFVPAEGDGANACLLLARPIRRGTRDRRP